jgi:hypothetical protein
MRQEAVTCLQGGHEAIVWKLIDAIGIDAIGAPADMAKEGDTSKASGDSSTHGNSHGNSVPNCPTVSLILLKASL